MNNALQKLKDYEGIDLRRKTPIEKAEETLQTLAEWSDSNTTTPGQWFRVIDTRGTIVTDSVYLQTDSNTDEAEQKKQPAYVDLLPNIFRGKK